MLAITRMTDYAMIALADLAKRHPSVVSTRDVSKRARIPTPVLQKLLTKLTNEDLVVSVRGPKGGYRLSRPPDEIALADVIAAIEGSFRLACCTGTSDASPRQRCTVRPVCSVIGSMRKVHVLLEQCLAGVSVAQLAFDTVPEAVKLRRTTPRARRKPVKATSARQ